MGKPPAMVPANGYSSSLISAIMASGGGSWKCMLCSNTRQLLSGCRITKDERDKQKADQVTNVSDGERENNKDSLWQK